VRHHLSLFLFGLLAGLSAPLAARADGAPGAAGAPAAAPGGTAKADDGGELRFQFVQLKDRGVVRGALYATPEDYMKKSFRETVGAVSGGRAVCVFSHINTGTYSMAAFHDENNNDKLDTGIFGIPVEGFCTSNNAKGTLGPPKYKDAAFSFSGSALSQDLRMKYR
jgi:uncharacterized protein (DUF2141 family)